MLFRQIICIYCGNKTKCIQTLCDKTQHFFVLQLMVHNCSYDCVNWQSVPKLGSHYTKNWTIGIGDEDKSEAGEWSAGLCRDMISGRFRENFLSPNISACCLFTPSNTQH
jgi:hypothetical protein